MKRLLRHPLILSCLAILFVGFLYQKEAFKIPQNLFYNLTASAQKVAYPFSVKIDNFFDFIRSINQLKKENQKLTQENKKLLTKISLFQKEAQENDFLRNQLGLEETISKNLILAKVINRTSAGYNDCILINQGEEDGVVLGATVITSGNILIGKVVEISDDFSKIRLILSPNSRIHATLQKSKSKGVVKGESGGLIIDFLPPEGQITIGETIVTSGLAGAFPSGFLIGKIAKVISCESQSSKKAQVEPIADFLNLHRVFVVQD